MVNMFDLTGRVAVVTGARRGIGYAMAEALSAAGADIIGVSAALESEGSAIGAAVLANGRSFEARTVDFADRDAVLALGTELATRAPDILVNNAGTIERAPAIDHPLASWDRVLQIDLTSQFILTQALARPMIARGYGKVIFTASLLSFQGGINVAWIHSGEVGRRRTHESTVQRVGAVRCERQRDRAGIHRNRQHSGATRRPRSVIARYSTAFLPDAGVKHLT